MAEITVANTYAQALFDLGTELGKAEQFNREITELDDLMEHAEDLKHFLLSPAVEAKEKKELVENTFHNELSPEVLNFLFVLIDKGRMGAFHHIRKCHQDMFEQSAGISEGIIVSAEPLTENQLGRFTAELSKLLRKQVQLTPQVDEKLIGGVMIQIEGRLIDRSVRTELEKMLHQLKN